MQERTIMCPILKKQIDDTICYDIHMNVEGLNVSKEKIKEVLARMELSETVRGETLTLEQFAQLADLLRG